MGTMFKTLKDLKESTKTNRPQGDGERVNRFFSLKSGQDARLRFRQELTEDAVGYDEEAGGAIAVMVHTNPADFRKSAECTADNEEYGYRCWACEQVPKDKGWKAKKHLLINIAVFNADEKTWEPRVLDHKFTPAHCAETILEYATEYDTIVDRDYKISRVGEKQSTNYSLIPLAAKDADASIKDLPLHDLNRHYKLISPAEQPGFYIADQDTSSSGSWD